MQADPHLARAATPTVRLGEPTHRRGEGPATPSLGMSRRRLGHRGPLSPDAHRLMADHLSSAGALDLFMLLRGDPERWWSSTRRREVLRPYSRCPLPTSDERPRAGSTGALGRAGGDRTIEPDEETGTVPRESARGPVASCPSARLPICGRSVCGAESGTRPALHRSGGGAVRRSLARPRRRGNACRTPSARAVRAGQRA
jgi:hypothetical protein